MIPAGFKASWKGEMFTVVVPTYNERRNIRPLIERVMEAFRAIPEPAELLFVDDDSPDGTAEEIRTVSKEVSDGGNDNFENTIRVIVREGERGLAGAVNRGFREASGDVLVVMDADLSHPPEVLPNLLEAIRSGGVEVAVASRRVKGGGIENWPLNRRFISWVSGLLARPLVPVRDTTSGFFAVKRECIEAVELRSIGYKIGLEVLARGKYEKAMEVPFVFTDRQFGQSKLGGKVMLAYLVQLGSLYRERWPNIVRFIQFGLVGLLGAFVDAAVFNTAMWYGSLASLGHTLGGFLSQSLSFLVAVFFNFALNKRWTFHEQKAQASLLSFFVVCTLGYLLRSAAFVLIINSDAWLGKILNPVALANTSLAAGIVVASFWNYFASKRWAFGVKDF